MTALALVAKYWRVALLALLLAALGAQSYRLKASQARVAELVGQVNVFVERESAQRRAQALRELHNLKAKERTDEEYSAALRRAASGVVRVEPVAPVVAGLAPGAGGGLKPSDCVGGGELEEWAAGAARRNAERLTEVLRGIAGRLGGRATGAAGAGEGVGAAFRACRAWALSLD